MSSRSFNLTHSLYELFNRLFSSTTYTYQRSQVNVIPEVTPINHISKRNPDFYYYQGLTFKGFESLVDTKMQENGELEYHEISLLKASFDTLVAKSFYDALRVILKDREALMVFLRRNEVITTADFERLESVLLNPPAETRPPDLSELLELKRELPFIYQSGLACKNLKQE